MTIRHVFRETAATKPRFPTLGHVGKFNSRHAIGNVDAMALTALRADVFVLCCQCHASFRTSHSDIPSCPMPVPPDYPGREFQFRSRNLKAQASEAVRGGYDFARVAHNHIGIQCLFNTLITILA